MYFSNWAGFRSMSNDKTSKMRNIQLRVRMPEQHVVSNFESLALGFSRSFVCFGTRWMTTMSSWKTQTSRPCSDPNTFHIHQGEILTSIESARREREQQENSSYYEEKIAKSHWEMKNHRTPPKYSWTKNKAKSVSSPTRSRLVVVSAKKSHHHL